MDESFNLLILYPAFFAAALSLGAYYAAKIIIGPPLIKILASLAAFLAQTFLSFTLPAIINHLNVEASLFIAWLLTLLLFFLNKRQVRLRCGGLNHGRGDVLIFLLATLYLYVTYNARSESGFRGFPIINYEFYLYHAASIMRFIQEGSIWVRYGFIEHYSLTHEAIAGAFVLFTKSVGVFLWLEYVFIAIYAATTVMLISKIADRYSLNLLLKILFLITSLIAYDIIIKILVLPTKNDLAAGTLGFAGVTLTVLACEQIKKAKEDFFSVHGILAVAAVFLGLAAGMKPSPLATAAACFIILAFSARQGVLLKKISFLIPLLAYGLTISLSPLIWIARNFYLLGNYQDVGWGMFFWPLMVWKVVFPFHAEFSADSSLPPFALRAVDLGPFRLWLISIAIFAASGLLWFWRGGWSVLQALQRNNFFPTMLLGLGIAQLALDLFFLPGGFSGPYSDFVRPGAVSFPDTFLYRSEARYFIVFILLSLHLFYFIIAQTLSKKFTSLIAVNKSPRFNKNEAHSRHPLIIAAALFSGLMIMFNSVYEWEAVSSRGHLPYARSSVDFADNLTEPSRIAIIGEAPTGLFYGRFLRHSVYPFNTVWNESVNGGRERGDNQSFLLSGVDSLEDIVCPRKGYPSFNYIVLAVNYHFNARDYRSSFYDWAHAKLMDSPHIDKISEDPNYQLAFFKVKDNC